MSAISRAKTPFESWPGKARAEITGWRLFVHEYRCMAAPANATGWGFYAMNSGDIDRGCNDDPTWP
jgi:hypothetical protein